MPAALVGGVIAGAGAIGAAAISSSASSKASKAQAQGADASLSLQKQEYDQSRADLAPWRSAGSGALAMLSDALGLNGPEGNARGASAFKTSPGYDFAMSEGEKAVDAGAYAKGTGRSGATFKAENRFAQGTADQEFGGWLGKLGTLAGFGQSATQTGVSANNAFAVNAGNAVQDAAAATASGYVGSANAISSGVNNLAKLAGNYFDPNAGYGFPGSVNITPRVTA